MLGSPRTPLSEDHVASWAEAADSQRMREGTSRALPPRAAGGTLVDFVAAFRIPQRMHAT